MTKISQKNLFQESKNHDSKSLMKRSSNSVEGRTMRKKEPRLSQRDLYFRFKKNIIENNLFKAGDRVVAACSGGPDSVALLHLLVKLSADSNFEIIVAHYNHKIRGREADKDELFVKKIAEELKLKFVSTSANAAITSEEQAREQRYHFLEGVRVEERANFILTAHNLDDLSETMLFNIVRGSGIRGLYSLRPKRDKIIRPLLFAKKNDILLFLAENKISYRIDASNKKLIYSRNIMRHKILPEIAKINPSYSSAFARLSTTAAEIDDFIGQYALEMLQKISNNENGKILILQKDFVILSPAIQREIIRIIADKFDVIKDLTASQVDDVLGILNKKIGKKEKMYGSKLKIMLQAGRIIIVSKE